MWKYLGRLAAGYVFYLGVALVVGMLQESKVGWPSIRKWPRIGLFVGAMLGGTTLMTPIGLLVTLLGGQARGRIFSCWMMKAYFSRIGPLLWGPFTFEGVENLPDRSTAAVYMANHQSTVDLCTIFCLPNGPPAVSVAKSSMVFLPGFGPMVKLMGSIMVSRGKKGTTSMLLKEGKQRLDSGLSVGIFPQGTRRVPTAEKNMLPFKRGAFLLAVEAQVPIIPFTIIYPNDFMSRPGPPVGVHCIIHKPIPPGDDAAKLTAEAEKTILGRLLEHHKGALPPKPLTPKPESKDKKA